MSTDIAGGGIINSVANTGEAIANGDWGEFAASGGMLALDGLFMAADPVGECIALGVSLIIEHIPPVTDLFDKLTGDPTAIQAGAETWTQVQQELETLANEIPQMVQRDLPTWEGEARKAYDKRVQELTEGVQALSGSAGNASSVIATAGTMVAVCREIVRELISMLIAELAKVILAALGFAPLTFGASIAGAVAWAVGRIGIEVGRIAAKLAKLLAKLGKAGKLLAKVLDDFAQAAAKVGGKLTKLGGKLADKGKAARDATRASNAATRTGRKGATEAASAGGETAAKMADDVAPAAAKGGDEAASAGAKGTEAAGKGADDAAAGTKGAGKGADDAAGSGAKGKPEPENPKPTKDLETCGDPVDVVSGQMVLQQTDLELAGVLPLVLARTHLSSYRSGRSFGRSWASTLDQRLQPGAGPTGGVRFVAEDGMLLDYPQPPADGTSLPAHGPRWPLARTDGGYAITQPVEGRTLEFTGSADGELHLSVIADRNGNRIEVDRDAAGTPMAVRHSGGYHVDVASVGGRITGLRLRSTVNGSPNGESVQLLRYAYADSGQLTDVINSSGRPMRFDYDPVGRITGWTDRNGEWYRYLYDEQGRCVANVGAGGYFNGTFDYDPENRTTRYVDALGHATTYVYNEAGKVIAETNPLGNTTRTEWDEHDRLLTRTDPLGRTTRYEYDDDGNLVRLTRPDGTQVLAEYNAVRLPTQIIDPDGAVWRREYDPAGNLLAVIDPAGALTRYTYNPRGGLTGVIDALGGERRVQADGAGLPVTVVDGLGATTRYQRDLFGRVTTVIDPAGGAMRLSWNVEGKLLARTMPDGAVERWTYDPEGNLTEHLDAVGQPTRTSYGHFDLPVAQTGPDGARLEFGYDPTLRLVSVTNPQGLTWRYDYDAAGNLVTETDFNGRTLRYEHDLAGQLTARTNGAGETVTFARDPLGNVVEKRAGETVTTFAFDEAGRMVRAASPEVELVFERDPLGRVLSETVDGRTLRWSYDALGRRLHRRTPTGAESTWAYDANDQPVSLTSGGHTLRFDYDAAGREVRRQLGAGAVLAQSWDAAHRLSSQTLTAPDLYAAGGSPRLVQQRAYHYRPDGYLLGVDDQLAGSRRFDLDRAGRVTAVHGRGWVERYAYDAAGNITDAGWPVGPDGAGAPEAQGRREYAGTLIRRAGNTSYQHDPQGRVVRRLRRTLSGQQHAWSYRWDAEDRLVGVTTPDGSQWRYVYDPLGRRVAKHLLDGAGAVAATTAFTWDGVTLAEQTSTGATTTWDFEPGSFRPVTQTERARAAVDGPQEWVDQQFYALVTDLIGTPTEMVDPDGDLAWRSHSTLWGQALARLTTGPTCPLRFPGQYHDPETGDNYNYFRYYDPTCGRYGAADPLGLEGGSSPHQYVRNPEVRLDPLGLKSVECSGKIKGTEGLKHSFDRHAAQWFGRNVDKATHMDEWESVLQRAAQSDKKFDWSTGGSQTTAHLARIDGKYLVVQFFKDGPHAGEIATAFVPKNNQLSGMLRAAGIGRA